MVSSGLVDRVDVSHFRLSVHLLIAFYNFIVNILELFKKLKLTPITQITIGLFLPSIFIINIYTNINRCICFGMDAGKIYNSWPLMGNLFFLMIIVK